ncbi:uncharacterized protein MONBRDRAFT_28432 [Monosiga brevicollis MX1]|uniref:Fungal lipase-type domain-containing protein n=1 Tax=Monosiga brevicollis TaxID=81824 RepID=A9V856_MONBE|nr:uncharacterized protein MONBRDRAFT_28432 [Monosiga brevicollis MX1]EDQ86214.1 predicted protein [Monosiga brevicollis MX1]|eukprot:XP_001748884.1 hypothetical protein [Monosiga brevicollis MX1]
MGLCGTDAASWRLAAVMLVWVLSYSSASTSCRYASPWSDLAQLRAGNLTVSEWHAIIGAFANVTTDTYTNGSTSNVGGYRELTRLAPDFGLHAIVLQAETDPQRIIIAFRGTDLNESSPSGQVDNCADWLIWHPWLQPPSYCQNFNRSTYDYVTNALHLVAKVQAQYPSASLVTTGHSLGAGLAFLTAINHSTPEAPVPAVAFACPGILGYMRRQHWVPTSDSLACLLQVDDSQDPAVHLTQVNQTGVFLRYDTGHDLSCDVCFKNSTPSLSHLSPWCALCFDRHHIYRNYLNKIFNSTLPTFGVWNTTTNTAWSS